MDAISQAPSLHTSETTSQSKPLDHFRLFPNLPLELRRLIWNYAFAKPTEGRITILRDPMTLVELSQMGETSEDWEDDFTRSRRNSDNSEMSGHVDPDDDPAFTDLESVASADDVGEPALDNEEVKFVDERVPFFQVCSESRSMLLANSQRYVVPRPAYHFININEDRLREFLIDQGFCRQKLASIHRLLEAALDYYNTYPSEAVKYPLILRLGPPLTWYQPSQWFDRQEDFLLLRFSHDADPYHSTMPEWNHAGTLAAEGARKLAIEMSRADWDHGMHFIHATFPPKIWSRSLATGEVDWSRLQSVQQMVIWTREGCEVCSFTIDTQDLLGPDEWSFRLDNESQMFKKHFGIRWSNITWRIVFGKSTVIEDGEEREKNVCEMLRDWRPHSSSWWNGKVFATRTIPKVCLGRGWEDLLQRSATNPLVMEEIPRIVEGAPERTYYGPSF